MQSLSKLVDNASKCDKLLGTRVKREQLAFIYEKIGYILKGYWKDKTGRAELQKIIIPQVAAFESLRLIVETDSWENNIWEGYIPEDS